MPPIGKGRGMIQTSLNLEKFVTLNLFQGPWIEVARNSHVWSECSPWMLKQVQHDEVVF
jgi:hypothetical protein